MIHKNFSLYPKIKPHNTGYLTTYYAIDDSTEQLRSSKKYPLFQFVLPLIPFLFCACGMLKNSQDYIVPQINEDFLENDFLDAHSDTLQWSKTKYWDLIHTELDLTPNFDSQSLDGTAIISLKPHFYGQDSVILDAVNMDIYSVQEFNSGNTLSNSITLDETIISPPGPESRKFIYSNSKQLIVYFPVVQLPENPVRLKIQYTAFSKRKNAWEINSNRNSAISDDKGLYIINADLTDPCKPRQLWTQGEPNSNCHWFPTLDAPNQKHTQKITVRYPDTMVSLSNGILISRTYSRLDHPKETNKGLKPIQRTSPTAIPKTTANNLDGTITDVWEQKQAHAPYLTMLAIGNWSVIEDSLMLPDETTPLVSNAPNANKSFLEKNNSERKSVESVSLKLLSVKSQDKFKENQGFGAIKQGGKSLPIQYFVEPKYAKYAKMIFGNTPEMIKFFSSYTGVRFQWDKYAQVVVRDFVSGAMENTSATVHMEQVQHDSLSHQDQSYEDYISHELFHQWFGDYVTAENWSDLTLNESFATYAEYLWREYKYGQDNANFWLKKTVSNYKFASRFGSNTPLLNHKYHTANEQFDAVRYQKGAGILHVLRNYIGDEAFRASMHDYLEAHKFGSAEVADWRMSIEKVTGKDMKPFFRLWYENTVLPQFQIMIEKTPLNKGDLEGRVLPPNDDSPHSQNGQKYQYQLVIVSDVKGYASGNKQATMKTHIHYQIGETHFTKEVEMIENEKLTLHIGTIKPSHIVFDPLQVIPSASEIDYVFYQDPIEKIVRMGEIHSLIMKELSTHPNLLFTGNPYPKNTPKPQYAILFQLATIAKDFMENQNHQNGKSEGSDNAKQGEYDDAPDGFPVPQKFDFIPSKKDSVLYESILNILLNTNNSECVLMGIVSTSHYTQRRFDLHFTPVNTGNKEMAKSSFSMNQLLKIQLANTEISTDLKADILTLVIALSNPYTEIESNFTLIWNHVHNPSRLIAKAAIEFLQINTDSIRRIALGEMKKAPTSSHVGFWASKLIKDSQLFDINHNAKTIDLLKSLMNDPKFELNEAKNLLKSFILPEGFNDATANIFDALWRESISLKNIPWQQLLRFVTQDQYNEMVTIDKVATDLGAQTTLENDANTPFSAIQRTVLATIHSKNTQ